MSGAAPPILSVVLRRAYASEVKVKAVEGRCQGGGQRPGGRTGSGHEDKKPTGYPDVTMDWVAAKARKVNACGTDSIIDFGHPCLRALNSMREALHVGTNKNPPHR